MLRVLPEWSMELENKLDKVIKDLAVKNQIDIMMVDDSKAIADAKSSILHALLRLYDYYDVENSERLREFEKDMKKAEKQKKKKGILKND